MTPPDPQQPGPLERLKAWIAHLLGNEYAPVAKLVSSVVSTFVAAVAAKAISEGISIPQISHLAWWDAIGYAGIAAAVQLILGLIATKVTGTPELLGFVSHTLRAQRDHGRRVLHFVPLRRPKPALPPGPRHGDHEAA